MGLVSKKDGMLLRSMVASIFGQESRVFYRGMISTGNRGQAQREHRHREAELLICIVAA
jgi:hypothetical protein